METTNNSTTQDWIIFLISLIACIVILYVRPEWFWVTLPFIGTYLMRALRMM